LKAQQRTHAIHEAQSVMRSLTVQATMGNADADIHDEVSSDSDEADCVLRAAPRRSTRAASKSSLKQPADSESSPGADEGLAGPSSQALMPQSSRAEGSSGQAGSPRQSGGGKENNMKPAVESATPTTGLPGRARVLKAKSMSTTVAPATTGRRSRFAAMRPQPSSPAMQQPSDGASTAATADRSPAPPATATAEPRIAASMTVRRAVRSQRQVTFAGAGALQAPQAPAQVPSTPAQRRSMRTRAASSDHGGGRKAAGGGAGGVVQEGQASGSTPFTLHRLAPAGDLEEGMEVLGARLHGLALDSGEVPPMMAAPAQPALGGCIETLERGPVLLILGSDLHSLPWESLPCMQNQRYCALSISDPLNVQKRGSCVFCQRGMLFSHLS
jgi:hypothetical protein